MKRALVKSFGTVKKCHYAGCREEQDLLDILDLELFDVKILVSILIEPFLATVILLDSCLFVENN